MNYMPYGMYFDPNILSGVKDLTSKIKEETTSEEPDYEKIMKLRMARLYKGMMLNNGNYKNNRAMYPY